MKWRRVRFWETQTSKWDNLQATGPVPSVHRMSFMRSRKQQIDSPSRRTELGGSRAMATDKPLSLSVIGMPARRVPYRRIGARETSGASVTYGAHIAYSCPAQRPGTGDKRTVLAAGADRCRFAQVRVGSDSGACACSGFKSAAAVGNYAGKDVVA